MNISKELEEYIVGHSQEEPPLLKELRKETHLKILQPHMISGIIQGRFLSMMSKLIQPKNILEIGTFTGYSALSLAEGLAPNGKLITIDKNPELQYLSDKYLQLSDKNIEFISGDALDIIPTLEDSFDLVFLDADKDKYPEYLPLILDKTHSGSVILVDNVLWKEKILDPNSNDKKTKALREFNEKILANTQLEIVILPIRDGISVIRRN